MSEDHKVVAIVPCHDLAASEAFYCHLGFEVVGDFGDYLILSDNHGWHLHLRVAQDLNRTVEENPFGLYLYVDDVDAVADRVGDKIIEAGTPHNKPWGTYEFAISDPSGLLIRVGRSQV
jgi:catechol 2,3-dioxygenase-like lactoylglutathione lyase family enzyme